ncbi:MAG: APC family permease [Candidatus Pacebacteria bacterium]|nr:APC family permease [Candidatus Paceibacterota bacterium]
MSKKRTPCPHCGELILPEAKKCRFCGEPLTKKKSLSLRTLYWVWFFSMIMFLTAIFFVRRAPTTSAGFWIVVLGFIVLGGLVAYLALMVKVLSSIKTRSGRFFGLATLVTFLVFFGLLFKYDKIEAKLGFTPPQVEQPSPQLIASPLPTVTPMPTNKPAQKKTSTTTSNQINCTGSDGKVFKTTQEECDNFNKAWGNVAPPDQNEIIRCNIHPNCGGGYKEMTRASCEQMTCCAVDFNNTMKFTSKDQCSREQQQNTSKAWSDTCNTMCSAYDSNTCANYWAVGTQGRADCISDANRQKTECLTSCYNHQ